MHRDRVGVLRAVVPTWFENASNFPIELADVRNVACRERLVHQIELAAVEGRQVEHIPLDQLDLQAVLIGDGSIALELLGTQIDRSDPAPKRG